MKYLLFFATCLILWKGEARNLTTIQGVFVSSVVNPDDHEFEELTKLMAYPVLHKNLSILHENRLALNYSIIFSSEPDDVTTVKLLDLDTYSVDYFKDLIKQHNTTSKTALSLKGLRKALEISPPLSVIVVATNGKPEDTQLIQDILELTFNKTMIVIVLQLKHNNSELIGFEIRTNGTENAQVAVKILDQSNEIESFYAISNITKSSLFLLGVQQLMDYYLPTPVKDKNAKKVFVFLYDVVNANENELVEISKTMETYFHSKIESPYNTTDHYSLMFPSQFDATKTIEKSVTYSFQEFKNLISPYNANATRRPSLEGLKEALRITSSKSWIAYFVDSEPEDKYELLPEIVQIIYDKRMNIFIHGYGKLSNKPLPMVYKTILEASTIAISNGPTIWLPSFILSTIFLCFIMTRVL